MTPVIIFIFILLFCIFLFGFKRKSNSNVMALEADLLNQAGKKVGEAEWSRYDNQSTKLKVKIYGDQAAGTSFEIIFNNMRLGDTRSYGQEQSFYIASNEGHNVPIVNKDDVILVRKAGQDFAKGTFKRD